MMALAEGISYLTLLGISMPLKYIFDMPMFVKVNGWIHGVLFIFFCLFLLQCMLKLKWTFFRALVGFVASLVPFGAFWFDKSLKREEAYLDSGTGE
tara:strand:- start:590 stop:877 length:288 start_codon:yes stop_codon:yes gene_type:complete